LEVIIDEDRTGRWKDRLTSDKGKNPNDKMINLWDWVTLQLSAIKSTSQGAVIKQFKGTQGKDNPE